MSKQHTCATCKFFWPSLGNYYNICTYKPPHPKYGFPKIDFPEKVFCSKYQPKDKEGKNEKD